MPGLSDIRFSIVILLSHLTVPRLTTECIFVPDKESNTALSSNLMPYGNRCSQPCTREAELDGALEESKSDRDGVRKYLVHDLERRLLIHLLCNFRIISFRGGDDSSVNLHNSNHPRSPCYSDLGFHLRLAHQPVLSVTYVSCKYTNRHHVGETCQTDASIAHDVIRHIIQGWCSKPEASLT